MRPSELWVLLAIIFTCQEVGRTETTKFAAAPDRLQQQDLDRKVLMSLMNTLHEQAEDGNATATRLLGCCVSLQSSRASDLTLAFRCFLTASQLGDVDSKFNLAVCYAAGRGVRQDQYKASKLFLEVADAGDAEAQYVMGKRFAEGKGCEQDIERSNELLLLAAQAGHRAASFNIAWRFMKGKGMRLRKEIQPFYLGGGTAKLLTNASKKLANTHGPDPVEAEKWFEQSATSGYAKSLYNLCNIRRKADKQVIQGSTLRLLILAAKNDYPRAQYALSRLICRFVSSNKPLSSVTSSPDLHLNRRLFNTSVILLCRSAAQGYPKALYTLGLRYQWMRGNDTANLVRAMRCFNAAHRHGYAKALQRWKDCNQTYFLLTEPERMERERRERRRLKRQEEEAELNIRNEIAKIVKPLHDDVQDRARCVQILQETWEVVKQRHQRAENDQIFKKFTEEIQGDRPRNFDLDEVQNANPLQEVMQEFEEREEREEQHAFIVSPNKIFEEEMKKLGSKILADVQDRQEVDKSTLAEREKEREKRLEYQDVDALD